jgi:hypothetical protein
MADPPAAGVRSPSGAARQAPRPEKQALTRPTEQRVRRSATDVHTYPKKKTFHAGVEHKEEVVASLHPCPWTMVSKGPRLHHDGVHGVAAEPIQAPHSPGVKARNLDHQWTLEGHGSSGADGDTHDTRGPIGHECRSSTRKATRKATRSCVRYLLQADGSYLVAPDHHDGQPEKSVTWQSDKRSSQIAKHEMRYTSTTRNSSGIGHPVHPRRAEELFQSQLRDQMLARREAGWVDPSQGAADQTESAWRQQQPSHHRKEQEEKREPDEESEDITAAAAANRPTRSLGHPLFDMLAGFFLPAPAPAPAPKAASEASEQPWWDGASDGSEEEDDYPKPWRTNMSPLQAKAKPGTSSSTKTPAVNPLAHLQTESSDSESAGLGGGMLLSTPPRAEIRRAINMPGGAKFRSPSSAKESPRGDEGLLQHREVLIQENSPWRWAAERERERESATERRSKVRGGGASTARHTSSSTTNSSGTPISPIRGGPE